MPIKIKPIRVEGNIAYVPLTRGYEAIIDAADVCLVSHCSWRANISFRADGSIATVYATSSARKNYGHQIMHRVLMSAPCGIFVDHVDGNGLNNRRGNLRLATNAQNQHNQGASVRNKSGAKGVHWHKQLGRWQALICAHGQRKFLGTFATVQEAAAAYAAASIVAHGEFAKT